MCFWAMPPSLVMAGRAMVKSAAHCTVKIRVKEYAVAFTCDICSKKHQSGHNVSHANNKTKRTFNPNLQRVRAVVDGSTKRIRVCTRCLRSGKVTKAL